MQRGIVSQFSFLLVTFIIATNGLSIAAENTEKSIKPFDTEATVLPSNYVAHDIVALYKHLLNAFPRKGEFESSEAYLKRLQQGSPQGIYAFLIEFRDPRFPMFDGVNASYNPDTKRMVVGIDSHRILDIYSKEAIDKLKKSPNYDPYRTTINIKHISESSEKYEASNKFGAKIIVTKETGSEYGIGVVNLKSLATLKKGSFEKIQLTFNISSDKGRDLKDNLGVILVCRMRTFGDPPKYTFTNFNNLKATMDSPVEIVNFQHFINVDLFQIWIFNRNTGIVYSKEKILPIPRN